jgi:pilus assembly protein TadC
MAWAGPTRQDLDLIGRSVTTHYGEKALSALIALMTGPILTMGASLAGLTPPIAVPAAGSLAFALGAWLLPDMTAKTKARKARETFRRAVSTYLELLAIERASGTGVNQAAFAAADVAKSWPFKRISQALELGHWDGKTPWAALRQLSQETAVTELADVADILEQAGREGSAIHDQLQSRAAAMRDAQLDVEQQIAHDATVRMTIPGTLTVLVYFMALLIPALMSMLTTTS